MKWRQLCYKNSMALLPSSSTFLADSQPPRHWNQKSVEQHVENTIKSCGMIRGAKRCGSGYTRTLRDSRSKWSPWHVFCMLVRIQQSNNYSNIMPKRNQSRLQQIRVETKIWLEKSTMDHAVYNPFCWQTTIIHAAWMKRPRLRTYSPIPAKPNYCHSSSPPGKHEFQPEKWRSVKKVDGGQKSS